ncbi:hypothetical protein [Amycolatopsis magusensis]|uniref:hypothetical protein n=1 Tax=Amycolatopsis magusensis TaxID=882444 RepID=UPI0037904078
MAVQLVQAYPAAREQRVPQAGDSQQRRRLRVAEGFAADRGGEAGKDGLGQHSDHGVVQIEVDRGGGRRDCTDAVDTPEIGGPMAADPRGQRGEHPRLELPLVAHRTGNEGAATVPVLGDQPLPSELVALTGVRRAPRRKVKQMRLDSHGVAFLDTTARLDCVEWSARQVSKNHGELG